MLAGAFLRLVSGTLFKRLQTPRQVRFLIRPLLFLETIFRSVSFVSPPTERTIVIYAPYPWRNICTHARIRAYTNYVFSIFTRAARSSRLVLLLRATIYNSATQLRGCIHARAVYFIRRRINENIRPVEWLTHYRKYPAYARAVIRPSVRSS